jgi:hypothetical protein
MSKHSKIVSVSVNAFAKAKLENASKAIAEVATAQIMVSDDTFGPRGSRRR